MVAIVNRRPKQVGILEILDAFIAHQKEVILRRSKFDLDRARERLHIVEGLLKAVDVLDEVIRIIRASKNKEDSIKNLCEAFQFTYEQANAIVTMRLYRLSNTDVTALIEEQGNLQKAIEFLNSIINNEDVLKDQIKKSLQEIKREYASPRRTEIKDEVTEIKIDAMQMIPKENVVVVVTNEGYVKKIPLKSYSSASSEPTTLKPGDYITGLYSTTSKDTLLLFTNLGHYLYVPIHEIQDTKWKELGKHISNIIPLAPEERIIDNILIDNLNDVITIVTKEGTTKRINISELVVSRYSKPINAIKLKDNDEVVSAFIDYGNTIFITKNGYYLYFDSEEITIVSSKAAGVRGIKLKDDEVITGLSLKQDVDYLGIITDKNTAKRIKTNDLERASRALKGSSLIKRVKSKPYFISNAFALDIKNIIGLKVNGEIKGIKASDIPIMDMASTGSTITKQNLEDTFVATELLEKKLDENNSKEEQKAEEKNITNEEIEELTIDDFINDFKL